MDELLQVETPDFEISEADDLNSLDGLFDQEDESQEEREVAETAEAPDQQPKRLSEKLSARSAVSSLDFITSAVCGAISGDNRNVYKMTKDERAEIEEPLEVLFEYMQKSFHPGLAVAIAIIAVVGSKGWEAMDRRRENQQARLFEAEKRARAVEAEKKAKEYIESRRAMDSLNEVSDTQQGLNMEAVAFTPFQGGGATKTKRTTRKRFQIDADGLYERDVKGNYIQKEDRKERPTEPEYKLIQDCMSKGLSIKETNQILIDYNTQR